MKPIKRDEFTSNSTALTNACNIDLLAFGMYHAAPIENGKPVLSLRFDLQTACLIPTE